MVVVSGALNFSLLFIKNWMGQMDNWLLIKLYRNIFRQPSPLNAITKIPYGI
jgi:hypothetical protein